MYYFQRGKRRFRGSLRVVGTVESWGFHPTAGTKNFVVWMGRHQDITFTQNNDPSHHIEPIFHGKTVFLDLNFWYQPQSPVVWLRWSKLRNRGVIWGWRSPCRLWSLCWIHGRAVSEIWVGVLGPSAGRAGERGFKEMVSRMPERGEVGWGGNKPSLTAWASIRGWADLMEHVRVWVMSKTW